MSNPPTPYGTWAPPAGWQPPAPTPRRRRAWIWVLIASLLAIGALAGASFGILISKVKPPLDAANDYMSALARHDYADAFSQLCAEDRRDASPLSLERNVQSERLLRNLEDWDITPFDVNRDGSRASVDVDVRPDDSDERDIYTLLLLEIDGDWRPCGGAFGFETAASSTEVARAGIGIGRVGEHVHQ